MIKPTIGRVVWYWPNAHDLKTLGAFAYEGSDQPFAATVSFVHSDRMVNLSVVDHNGSQYERRSVTLLQDGDTVNSKAGYAEWMPYQKGQAAKTEALESKLSDNGDVAIEQEIQAKGLTAPRVTPADIEANIASEHYFTVTGESACASPENFDAELGRKIARQNAENKIWPLMGYELRSKLHELSVPRTGDQQTQG